MAKELDTWLAAAKLKIERMPEEAKELREMAKADLYFFAKLVNPGYVYGDVHKECYKWMQNYSLYGQSEDNSNKLIMLPRGHLKSHMVATWAAWIITRHPEITILYLSATAELAEKQLYAIQNILGSTIYQRYFPDYINPQEGKREKWSQRKFSIDHPKRKEEAIRDETIATAGLTTNTTGWHADIIVADDLVVPENAYTEDGREGVVKKASQFTSIRNAGGFTMACGTRYELKTPTTFIPALSPAETPEKESSKTTQSDGATPTRSADFKYTSGLGLCCFTSSLAIIESILSSICKALTIKSRLARGADVPTAVLKPRDFSSSKKCK